MSGGGTGGGAAVIGPLALAVSGVWKTDACGVAVGIGVGACVAIGWVAVTELELSDGKTSIGVSLFFIFGRFGAVGGASWCIGCPSG